MCVTKKKGPIPPSPIPPFPRQTEREKNVHIHTLITPLPPSQSPSPASQSAATAMELILLIAMNAQLKLPSSKGQQLGKRKIGRIKKSVYDRTPKIPSMQFEQKYGDNRSNPTTSNWAGYRNHSSPRALDSKLKTKNNIWRGPINQSPFICTSISPNIELQIKTKDNVLYLKAFTHSTLCPSRISKWSRYPCSKFYWQ